MCVSGCAVTPGTPIQSTNKLVIPLSGSDSKVYRLVDRTGAVVSRSLGNRNKLDFLIKENLNLNQCFRILNEKGKNIYEGNSAFALPRLLEYRQSATIVEEIIAARNEEVRGQDGAKFLYSQTRDLLENNRAFKDRRCYLPAERKLPPRPWTKCTSRSQCLEEGGAICYSRFLGTEGCAIALRQLNVAGMLSSPGCAAAAANLAGEKYDMDDAFVDFLHGAVDDVGTGMMEGESLLGNFLGLVLVGGNYVVKVEKAEQCTSRFVQKHYGPLSRWHGAVQNIQAEPKRTLDACVSLIKDNNQHVETINEYKKSIDYLSGLQVIAQDVSRYLISADQPAEICKNNRFNKFGFVSEKGMTRYFIGAGLEPVSDASGKGLKITSLTANDMPVARAGLEVNDVILKVEERSVDTVQQLVNLIQDSRGGPLDVDYLKGGRGPVLTLSIVPKKEFLSF